MPASLLLANNLQPERDHYPSVGILLRISDSSTKDECIRHLNKLVARTPLLHTRFNIWQENIEKTTEKLPFQLACTDLFFHSEVSWKAWQQNLPQFKVTHYPLVRLYWVTVSQAPFHFLVIVISRLLIDEAGARTLVRQFWSSLKEDGLVEAMPFEELTATWNEHWKEDKIQSLSTIWKNIFSGYATSSDTPFALLPVEPAPRYQIEETVMPAKIVQVVKNFILDYGGSPESLFLSAWFLMIHRFAQQKDICVLMYHPLSVTEGTIGNCNNMIPLRRVMVEAETFVKFYYGIHAFYKPLVHHGFPFRLIAEAISQYGLQPSNLSAYGFAFHDITGFHHPGQELVDVMGKYCLHDNLLNISWLDKKVLIKIEYNVAIYDQGMAKSLLACLLHFLENIYEVFNASMRTIQITPTWQLDIIRNPLANKIPPFNNDTRTRSVVPQFPGVSMLIADSRQQLLPAGAIGEIRMINKEVIAEYQDRRPEELIDISTSTGMLGYWQENGDVIQVGKNNEWLRFPGKRIFLYDLQVWINKHLYDAEAVVLVDPHSADEIKRVQKVKIFYNGKALTPDNFPWPNLPVEKEVVYISDFPLTPNGEIDTTQLLAYSAALKPFYILSSDPVVQRVKIIWKEVLGSSREIDINENFFAAGGNSLKALLIISGIFEAFNVALELKSVYDSWTIQKMATAIIQARIQHQDNAEMIIERITDTPDKLYPATPGQARLWSVCQTEAAIKAYNIRQVIKLSAGLDIAIFKQVILHLINEYEILRTVFVYDKNELKQKVIPAWDINAVFKEVQINDTDHPELIRRRYDQSLFVFSMLNGPLFHIELATFSNGQQYLFLSIHHIIADYWSLTVLFMRITKVYKELQVNKDPVSAGASLQHKDFSAWQRHLLAKQRDKYADYWKHQLTGLPLNTRLPYDFPRPEQRSYNGKMVHKTVDAEVKERLHLIGLENNASLQMTIFTILNLALYRYTQQNKNPIIVHFAGRDHEQLKNQIGLFVNTLPLIVSLDPSAGFDVNLQATKKSFLEAYDSQYYPFDWLLQDANVKWTPRSAPISSIGFNWLYFNNENVQDGIGEMFRIDDRGVSQFDMLITGIERGHELELAIEYSTDIYSPETMSLFLDEMFDIINALHKSTTPLQQLISTNIATGNNNFSF